MTAPKAGGEGPGNHPHQFPTAYKQRAKPQHPTPPMFLFGFLAEKAGFQKPVEILLLI